MRLVGAAMVRNEADLIEAFVRHNLSILDHLVVVDHGCVDGTAEILAALAAEGLALAVEDDPDLAQRQPERLTRAAREAFARGADAVVPLDGDEFLKVADRGAFERFLARVPADADALLDWQTYVPDFAAPHAAHPLQCARGRLATERHGLGKVVLGRGFAAARDAMLGPGNHTVLREGFGQDLRARRARLARVPAAIAALAHVPVRGAEQLVGKVTVGWLAHRAARRTNPDLAFHWRELKAEFDRGGPPARARLAEIAANYALPMAHWQPLAAIAMVDDPLPAPAPMRYDHLARSDGAALLRDFAARLESELAH